MGTSLHQTVSLIMAAKPLDVIVGQPTTETMNKMVEHILQTRLSEQQKQITEVMVQHSKLLAALSKRVTAVHLFIKR
jgi:N-dimethylarginine dimethylaminohydrolase